jgi:hypothetical protein
MGFYSNIEKNLSNILGWRTKKKIVVFESDDWGSVRMPSRKVYDRLLKSGLPINSGDSGRYNLYDGLASVADFDGLFSVLNSITDKNGVNPLFTAMSLVANPDFDKIRSSNFNEYFFEPFTYTLERYGLSDSIRLWQEGINSKLFIPQFHGREHLNVCVWMRALQAGDSYTLEGFNEGFWGFRNRKFTPINYQAAFDLEFYNDLSVQKDVISTGLDLFLQLHGYKANFFVPPNGPFNRELSEVTKMNGIDYVSTAKKHNEPLGNNQFKKSYHYLGQRNKSNQTYITRNCSFEPSAVGMDWIGSCLNEMKTAFFWGKPAIISTHRVNYIGLHDEKNRINGLKSLKELLDRMIKFWPDIEFYSSSELGDLISNKRPDATDN